MCVYVCCGGWGEGGYSPKKPKQARKSHSDGAPPVPQNYELAPELPENNEQFSPAPLNPFENSSNILFLLYSTRQNSRMDIVSQVTIILGKQHFNEWRSHE